MQKKIDQPESLYVRFARFAYARAQQVLPRYAHPKSPHPDTRPQLAACVLLKIYRNSTYYDTEEWLRASAEVRAVLELDTVPDYTTLAHSFAKIHPPLASDGCHLAPAVGVARSACGSGYPRASG